MTQTETKHHFNETAHENWIRVPECLNVYVPPNGNNAVLWEKDV